MSVLDEQVYIRSFGTLHVGRNAAYGRFVQQLFAFDTHDVHRHLAGDKFHAAVYGLLP